MAKNYAAIYNSTGDSSALNQRVFLKLEPTRGVMTIPGNSDFVYQLGGSSLNFSQPINPSPVRSDRDNVSTIKEKKSLEWSLPSLVMINTLLGTPQSAEVDPAIRLLYKSGLGSEDLVGGAKYNSSTIPDVTFSYFEIGDMWAKQARGCFVDQIEISLPGDGQSQHNFSGMGAESLLVGIGKSTANNTANTLTLQAGEGSRFPVGSKIMLIESNGTTLSADTPTGTARTVTSKTGDVLTVDGAVLADADGSGVGAPLYVVYFEPQAPVAINDPQTGLQGTFVSTSIPGNPCIRAATITIANQHEAVNYCWGEDALSGALFVPANRLNVTVSIEMNLNHNLVEFYNAVQTFEAQDLVFRLGDTSKRYLEIEMPKVIFNVPQISVPDTGSIPVSFEGTAYASAGGAGDAIQVRFI